MMGLSKSPLDTRPRAWRSSPTGNSVRMAMPTPLPVATPSLLAAYRAPRDDLLAPCEAVVAGDGTGASVDGDTGPSLPSPSTDKSKDPAASAAAAGLGKPPSGGDPRGGRGCEWAWASASSLSLCMSTPQPRGDTGFPLPELGSALCNPGLSMSCSLSEPSSSACSKPPASTAPDDAPDSSAPAPAAAVPPCWWSGECERSRAVPLLALSTESVGRTPTPGCDTSMACLSCNHSKLLALSSF